MFRKSALSKLKKKEKSRESDENILKYDALNSEINILVRMINFKLDFNNIEKDNFELLEKVSLISY